MTSVHRSSIASICWFFFSFLVRFLSVSLSSSVIVYFGGFSLHVCPAFIVSPFKAMTMENDMFLLKYL